MVGTSMTTALVLLALAFNLQGPFALADEAKLSPHEIVRRADSHRMPEGMISFLATVHEYNGSKLTHDTRYKVLSRSERREAAALCETIYPERQRGRKLLMEKDDLWLYTPDTKRPVRVSRQQRLTGEIANGDLVSTNLQDDYDATLEGHEKIEDEPVFHLKLSANRSSVTYEKIDYWVSEKDFLPVRAIFYAVSGKALKEGVYLKPKKILGKLTITEVKFTDALNKEHQSVLIYSEQKKVNIPDQAFNKENLG